MKMIKLTLVFEDKCWVLDPNINGVIWLLNSNNSDESGLVEFDKLAEIIFQVNN